jgi:hypothetical protein
MIVPSRAWPTDFSKQWRADHVGFPAISVIDDHVTIWAPAVEAYRKQMVQEGLENWYLHCRVPEPTNGFGRVEVVINYVPTMDPRRHLLTESHGLKIIVDHDQLDLLAGVVIGMNLPDWEEDR